MSVFDHMAWAKRQKTGSVGRKAVLMALAERTGDRPTCWPSQELIAEETEQSVRTVRRHLNGLEADGFIRSSRSYRGEDGESIPRGRARNRYELLVDQPDNLSGEESGDQPDKRDRPTGQTGPTNRTPEVDQPDTAVAAEVPVEEPVLEEPSLEHPPNPQQDALILVAETPPPADRFDDFWSVYPHRRARGTAEKAWAKALKIATADEIIAGAKAYADEQTRPLERGEWRASMALPASWLNAKRWLDEIPEPEQRAGAGEKPGFLTDADRDQPTRVMTKEEFLHGIG